MKWTKAGHSTPEGVSRQWRLVDQGLTMHAALRDRAARWSTSSTALLLLGSACSTAFAFAGTETALTIAGVSATRSTWLGFFSVALFCGTLLELVIDNRGVARRHEAATSLLTDLKFEYQQARPDQAGDWAKTEQRLNERYANVMQSVPKIPEKAFNKLKATHKRKVAISKILDEYPGLSSRAAARVLKRRLRRCQ